MSLEENATLLESERMNIQAWFFTTTLKYLIRGGRVSKAAGLIGETLGICPLLMIDAEGKLIPMEKVRTKKKVALALLDRMLSVTENGADYSGP
ncbi:MAG: DegV family protein, partial [Lachnospiraceae bacterium]|nr:DegV family protein [Lachnospiraceae bacterium]